MRALKPSAVCFVVCPQNKTGGNPSVYSAVCVNVENLDMTSGFQLKVKIGVQNKTGMKFLVDQEVKQIK